LSALAVPDIPYFDFSNCGSWARSCVSSLRTDAWSWSDGDDGREARRFDRAKRGWFMTSQSAAGGAAKRRRPDSQSGLALRYLLIGAAGLAGDADEEALVDEAVGDGRGGRGVVEELAPLLEGEVGGDDGGGALIAAVEDLVEQIRAAR